MLQVKASRRELQLPLHAMIGMRQMGMALSAATLAHGTPPYQTAPVRAVSLTLSRYKTFLFRLMHSD